MKLQALLLLAIAAILNFVTATAIPPPELSSSLKARNASDPDCTWNDRFGPVSCGDFSVIFSPTDPKNRPYGNIHQADAYHPQGFFPPPECGHAYTYGTSQTYLDYPLTIYVSEAWCLSKGTNVHNGVYVEYYGMTHYAATSPQCHHMGESATRCIINAYP